MLTLAVGLGINEQGCWGNKETAATTAPKEALTPEFALAKIKELAIANIMDNPKIEAPRREVFKAIINQPDSTLDVVAETLFFAEDLTRESTTERKNFLEMKAIFIEEVCKSNGSNNSFSIKSILTCKDEDALILISQQFYDQQPPQAPAPAVTVAAAAPVAVQAAAAAPAAAAANTTFYGLLNGGRNICYFNALMQALAALDAKDRFNDIITPLLQILSGQAVPKEALIPINLSSSSGDRLANTSYFDASKYISLLRGTIDKQQHDPTEIVENHILNNSMLETVSGTNITVRYKNSLLYFSTTTESFHNNQEAIKDTIKEKNPQVVIVFFQRNIQVQTSKPGETSTKLDNTPVDINSMLILKLKDSNYQLKSIIYFGGEDNRGHYMACVLRGENWYHCDDCHVRITNLQKKDFEKGVCMLFYEKINPATAPRVSAPGSVPVTSGIVETDPLAPLKQAILEDLCKRISIDKKQGTDLLATMMSAQSVAGVLAKRRDFYSSKKINDPLANLKHAILQYFYKYTTTGSGLTKEAISNILKANTVKELLSLKGNLEETDAQEVKIGDTLYASRNRLLSLTKTKDVDVNTLTLIIQTTNEFILKDLQKKHQPQPAPAQ